jgi:hypothetical protein
MEYSHKQQPDCNVYHTGSGYRLKGGPKIIDTVENMEAIGYEKKDKLRQ